MPIIKNSKGEFVSRMTIAEFARATAMSESTIRTRIKTGKLEAIRHGKSWLIDPDLCDEQEIEANNPTGNNGDFVKQSPLVKAKTEKEQAVAKMKQMELEQMRKNLVSARDVEKDAFKCARLLRDSLLRIPQKISAEVACETDPHRAELIMEREIRAALEIVANTKFFDFYKKEGLEDEPII